MHHDKYNTNYSGGKNEVARNREMSLIPDKILKETDSLSIDYRYPSDSTINHKSEIINYKQETINHKLQEIYVYYREKTNSKEELSSSRKNKILLRLKEFSVDQLKKAIDSVVADNFYGGGNDRGWKAGLDYIFRSFEITENLVNLVPRKSSLGLRDTERVPIMGSEI